MSHLTTIKMKCGEWDAMHDAKFVKTADGSGNDSDFFNRIGC